jgi:hypothetical protein
MPRPASAAEEHTAAHRAQRQPDRPRPSAQDTPTATALNLTPSTPNQSYTADKPEDAGPTVADTLLWEAPFRTAIFFTFGALALGLWYYLAHGNHDVTFTTGVPS